VTWPSCCTALTGVATRLVMILLSQRGLPASTIADLLGTDPCTVRRWIGRYNTHGVAGLADRPRSGRPAWAAHG
jgi:transposase